MAADRSGAEFDSRYPGGNRIGEKQNVQSIRGGPA